MAAELQPLDFAVFRMHRQIYVPSRTLAHRVLQIAQAVQRAVLLAKRESVFFPLNKAYSLPHPIDGYWGAAKVMLRPAADGAGVIAGAPPSFANAWSLQRGAFLQACVRTCTHVQSLHRTSVICPKTKSDLLRI